MDIQVQCYAGYRGEETPRRFKMGEQEIHVTRVLDRWLSTDHRYFKVLGSDMAVYILRHDEQEQRWELTFFKADAGSSP